MKKTTATLTTTLGLVLGSLNAQTVPLFINYQGRVTESNGDGLGTGTPVNRMMIFRIYDAPSGGTRLWSEQHTVTISNGEFSVLLGNGIDAVYNSVTEVPTKTDTQLDTVFTRSGILRYVEILVDNGDNILNASDAPIAPRQQITSTAYAFRARAADTITAGTDLQLNNSANYGLGYYGSTRPFNGVNVDGPVLFGQAGGALGSVNGGTKNIALRWNAAGSVGIGSADLTGAASTTKLVLQGDDSAAAPTQLNIRGNADTNKRLLIGYNTSSNYGSLQAYSGASSTTSLALNPSGGNVVIGTSDNGVDKLAVGGPIRSTGEIKGTRIAANGANGFSFQDNDADGGLFSPADGIVTIKTNAAERVRVTSQGRMGIGVDPTTTLDVRGGSPAITIGTTGGEEGALYFGNAGHGVRRFYSAANDVGLYTSSGDLYLSSQGTATNRFVLKNNGSVGIGTANPGGTKLVVESDNGNILLLRGTDNTKSLSIGYHIADDYSFLQSLHHLVNYTPLVLQPDAGRVGIGQKVPQAPLHVSGSANTTFFLAAYMDGDNVTASPNSNSVQPHSIISDARVRASAFDVMSDVRIKDIVGDSDGAQDLDKLMNIRITDYTFKDRIQQGVQPQKKVIAQQVEKVYPQAVGLSTNVVPDIFKKASTKDGWVELATDLKAGERVRLVSDKESTVHEVLEVGQGRFRTAYVPGGDTLFVYGREVKDFRSVDYEAIAMLNVSATQQIKKDQDAEVKSLRDENTILRAKVAEMEAKDTALSARIAAIEKAMLASDKTPGGDTVSIKTGKRAE